MWLVPQTGTLSPTDVGALSIQSSQQSRLWLSLCWASVGVRCGHCGWFFGLMPSTPLKWDHCWSSPPSWHGHISLPSKTCQQCQYCWWGKILVSEGISNFASEATNFFVKYCLEIWTVTDWGLDYNWGLNEMWRLSKNWVLFKHSKGWTTSEEGLTTSEVQQKVVVQQLVQVERQVRVQFKK